jgi:hypothetical protein
VSGLPANPDSVVIVGPNDDIDAMFGEQLATGPLYAPVTAKGKFLKTSQGSGTQYFHIPAINFRADCSTCERDEPWDRMAETSTIFLQKVLGSTSFHPNHETLNYRCRSCGETYKYYWVRFEAHQDFISFVKIGEYPALVGKLPTMLTKGMQSEDLAYYQKALRCRNFGFGVGAAAYLRKIIENRIDHILGLIKERLELEDPNSPKLVEIEKAKGFIPFETKVKLAEESLPASIKVDGHNPVKLIHKLSSKVIHSLSDAEGIKIFDVCQNAFAHLIEELHRDKKKREELRLSLSEINELMSEYKDE